MRSRTRNTSIVVALLLIATLVAGSAVTLSQLHSSALRDDLADIEVLAGDAPAAVALSARLFQTANEAIVVGDADTADWQEIEAVAAARAIPVFGITADTAEEVNAELKRLRVTQVALVGADERQVDPPSVSLAALGSEPVRPASYARVTVLSDPAESTADMAATAAAAGARMAPAPGGDPRASGEAVAALREGGEVLAVGSAFGDEDALRRSIEQALNTPELPGGGQILFPGRRIIALYGSPGAPELGPIGRQDLPATIARARSLAAEYDSSSEAPVIPGLEIIVTVASAEAGPDQQYSTMIDPEVIRPWVEEAGRAGVYVTLDLQPGRTDFLTQAKRYTDLLKHPHVGLALDPEWRLKPDQVHLRQIGSVDADEVNRTSAWLADLVRDNGLPQKAFVLHEFDANMLARRDRIATDRPELAVIIHADGHGTPPVKMMTWQRITTDLPPNVFLGWKNFYTEDDPTFTPAETMNIEPTPWFVSYQ